MFFVLICDLDSNIREHKARNIIFEVMLKSKIFDRLDLFAEFCKQLNCRNENFRKRVGLFEIKNIDKPNVTTIALNPKEYHEHFSNHSNNKKTQRVEKVNS